VTRLFETDPQFAAVVSSVHDNNPTVAHGGLWQPVRYGSNAVGMKIATHSTSARIKDFLSHLLSFLSRSLSLSLFFPFTFATMAIH